MTSKEDQKMSPKVHFMQGMFLYGEMEDILNEVAPPGFGHTKSGKGDKKGGTAAAFDRARKEGRFKGSKSDMFAIMWAQKNKGDKPHYKPGTNKKYKKYQDESFGFTIDSGEHKKASKKSKMRNLAKGNTNPNEKAAAEKKAGGPKLYGEGIKGQDNEMRRADAEDRKKGIKTRLSPSRGKFNVANMTYKIKNSPSYQKESLSVKDTKKLNKASMLSHSNNPKDQDRARARQVEIDYKDLVRQMKKKRMRNEATTMKDNNLFGNAYAGDKDWKKKNKKAMAHRYKTLHKGDAGGDVNEKTEYEKLKKKIGSKKKHDKPAMCEGISYKDFMSNVQKGIS